MSDKFDNLEELLASLSEEDLAEIAKLQDEEMDNIIVLNDENGNEAEFEFIDLIPYEGEEYVILLPCDESDEAGEVVILKLEEEGEANETYASVDDEKTLNAVFEIFKERFSEEFNFVD